MSIASIAANRESTPEWQTCTACVLLRDLDDVEAAALVDLLSDVTVKYTWLADQLQQQGLAVDWQALSRHARGRCKAKVKLR